MSRDPKKLRAHHDAWRARHTQAGGVFLSLPLDHVYLTALDRVRRENESRPDCLRRLIANAYNDAQDAK